MVEIRPIRGEDWQQLRAVRLRALADAPQAFGSTLAGEVQFPDGVWIARAQRGAAGETARTFVAVLDEQFHGLAGVFLSEEDRAVAYFVSFWVDPAHRRQRTGLRLMRAAEQWAQDAGAERLELWVTENNEAARGFYEQAGFADTGRRQPLPSHPHLQEMLMVKQLTIEVGVSEPIRAMSP